MVTNCLPISSAIAVVPSRESDKPASADFWRARPRHQSEAPLLQSKMCHVVEGHEVLGHKVNAPETGVGARRGEGYEWALARLFDKITWKDGMREEEKPRGSDPSCP